MHRSTEAVTAVAEHPRGSSNWEETDKRYDCLRVCKVEDYVRGDPEGSDFDRADLNAFADADALRKSLVDDSFLVVETSLKVVVALSLDLDRRADEEVVIAFVVKIGEADYADCNVVGSFVFAVAFAAEVNYEAFAGTGSDERWHAELAKVRAKEGRIFRSDSNLRAEILARRLVH